MGDRGRAAECDGDVVEMIGYELEAYALEGVFYDYLPHLVLWPPLTDKPHDLCRPSMMICSSQLGASG